MCASILVFGFQGKVNQHFVYIRNAREGDFTLASEYLKKKYENVKPDEPVVLTNKEKRQNWWYYHKWIVAACAAAVFVVGLFLKDILIRTEPDYRISCVSSQILQEETVQQLQNLLQSLGEDRNGDGKVLVQVDSYVTNPEDSMGYAVQVKLTAELQVGEGEIFLLENPAEFQSAYGLLLLPDGTMPEGEEIISECEYYAWENCPAVNQLDLGAPLYLARRGYATQKETEKHADYLGLWQAMTEGAVPEED